MIIRKAAAGDLEQVKALLHMLFRESAGMQPDYYRDAAPSDEYILEAINGPLSDILVAEIDGEVAGCAQIDQKETADIDCLVQQKYVFLGNMIVSPAHRRKGVATALLDAVRRWARERGLSYVELNVFYQNPAGRALYEKAGFAVAKYNMKSRVRV